MVTSTVGIFSLWWLLVAFAIHDGEEILTVGQFLRKSTDSRVMVPETRIVNMDKSITGQMSIAVLFLGTTVTCGLILSRAVSPHVGFYLFFGSVGVMFLDGVKHLLVSVVRLRYTPGVVTAALVELPYSVAVIHQASAGNVIGWGSLMTYTAIALVFVSMCVFLGFTIGGAVLPKKLPPAGNIVA